MSVNKIEVDNLVRDLKALVQAGINPSEAVNALKVIEMRRINSNLEYLGSIMEHAPWNIKS
ncbi:hypothetical protein ACN9PN_29315 [Klebsiella pasteurii]|jgi:hypothetical protein|uniref:hypothetical protein n=1 Tax=Klebsiella TaxID=570 RepID=UPI0012B8FBED|nr:MULTISPECIES: hypothetical protein [Klebsiella]EFG1536036.1 hypothetical protein [Escherichia coli]QLT62921.1 hypothetical protein HV202_03430 [Klebsiella oxytoca]HDZ9166960.1 hypothetical protein [Klebsiella quasipneumoniae subsp. quasipneumoniae]EIH5470277.1 hypothetical protein [Escherichia coli]MCQ3846131.1 hypothetical protein [Klebsiella pneumoniae]